MKMKIKHFENSDITSMDWVEYERKAALRLMKSIRLCKTATTSIWGIDVARSDARSVGAWLDGRGDMRAAWWKFYSRVYQAVVPGADLERTMYSFHRVHHAVTFVWLSYLVSVRLMTIEIRERGLLAAVRTAAASKGSPAR